MGRGPTRTRHPIPKKFRLRPRQSGAPAEEGGNALVSMRPNKSGAASGTVVEFPGVRRTCAAIVDGCDELLAGRVPDLIRIDEALTAARAISHTIPGRLGHALALVGAGASSASNVEVLAAIDSLRQASTPRARSAATA